jgi:hypothetical protein
MRAWVRDTRNKRKADPCCSAAYDASSSQKCWAWRKVWMMGVVSRSRWEALTQTFFWRPEERHATIPAMTTRRISRQFEKGVDTGITRRVCAVAVYPVVVGVVRDGPTDHDHDTLMRSCLSGTWRGESISYPHLQYNTCFFCLHYRSSPANAHRPFLMGSSWHPMAPIKSLHPQVVMIPPRLLLQLALESGVLTAVLRHSRLPLPIVPVCLPKDFVMVNVQVLALCPCTDFLGAERKIL